VTFEQSVAFLTGGSKTPGTLKGWLRAPDSAFNGDPVGSTSTIMSANASCAAGPSEPTTLIS
jgi:hypothetical protein